MRSIGTASSARIRSPNSSPAAASKSSAGFKLSTITVIWSARSASSTYFQRGGSQSIVHGLASRGAAHLRRVADVPFARLDWTTHNRSVKRLFLEHALMVSDIMVALELACRRRGDLRLLIKHEIPLPEAIRALRDPFRWTVTVSGKGKLGVIPDRVFALEFTDTHERILCFLEADRGTMPVERSKHAASSITRKLHAYAATWNAGIHRSRFGIHRLRVLTVTSSESRCESIRSAEATVSSGKGIFHCVAASEAFGSNFLSTTALQSAPSTP